MQVHAWLQGLALFLLVNIGNVLTLAWLSRVCAPGARLKRLCRQLRSVRQVCYGPSSHGTGPVSRGRLPPPASRPRSPRPPPPSSPPPPAPPCPGPPRQPPAHPAAPHAEWPPPAPAWQGAEFKDWDWGAHTAQGEAQARLQTLDPTALPCPAALPCQEAAQGRTWAALVVSRAASSLACSAFCSVACMAGQPAGCGEGY
jgi:hypothetical protein